MLIKVEASVFRTILTEMAVIYKNSDEYKAFNMRYKDKQLTVTSSSGVKYVSKIPAESDETGELDTNLLFKDVSELIPGRGSLTIELTPMYATIKTGSVDITLQQANEIVTPYTAALSLDMRSINTEDLVWNIKVLSNTSAFKKAYKLEPLLTLNTEACLVKFPTVWIQTRGTALSTNITPDDANILCKFEPTKLRERENDFIFFNEHAFLIIQKVTPSENNFDELASTCEEVCTLTQEGLLITLRKLLKVLGPGNCDLYFSEKGLRMRVLRAGANSMFTFGEVDKHLKSVQLPLDFVLQMFSIVGESNVKISMGGGRLCLSAGAVSILTSVSN